MRRKKHHDIRRVLRFRKRQINGSYNRNLAKHIRYYRKEQGLNPEWVAWEAGITLEHYYQIERCEVIITAQLQWKLAEIFEVTPMALDRQPWYRFILNDLRRNLNAVEKWLVKGWVE